MEENSRVLPSFDQLIDKLKPELEAMETKRLAFRSRCFKKWLMYMPVLVVVGIVLFILMEGEFLLGAIIGLIISLVALLVFTSSASNTICAEYKKAIILPFVRNLIENGKYNPYDGICMNTFTGCNLFKYPDRYAAEDLISGMIGKTNIEFSEVHAEEKYTTTDSKGRTQTHWRDIFNGFIFVADFHKDFAGRTEVCRNSWLKLRRNRVKMENPVFEKHFDVYSTDQIEARYILSVSMMERILQLEEKFKRKDMVISFWNSNVIIAIKDGTNHFEAGLWTSIRNYSKLHREYTIIRSFAEIVEELNLNLRIWTKE